MLRTALMFAAVFLLACGSPAPAKPPTLDALFPPGGSRGETVTVAASGNFSHWPVKIWTEGQGIDVTALPEKGKLSIKIACDARAGIHWLRLHDEEGATAPRPFLVGNLPEVAEVEPNDDPAKPQTIDGSTSDVAVTVNGKLARSGDVDGYAVSLRKGQLLVAALEANRQLGSPMDGLLQVVTADGFEVARNDDAPDLDPRVILDAPADGTYLVRVFALPAVPDSRIGYAGGDQFLYRLTLTTRGFLDHVFPLAVSRSAPGPVEVEAIGWNIPESARRLTIEDTKTTEEEQEPESTVTVAHPLLAGVGAVQVVAHPALVAVEPDAPEHPQDVTVPATISGRIDPPGDVDVFQSSARKGEKWRIRVESRSLGHPLDPAVRVLDASGKVVGEMDDPGRRRSTTRDPELTFTAPADGAYRIVVRDLNGDGGLLYAYRLTVTPPPADFSLATNADRFTLTPGTPLKVPLTIARDDEFRGTIEIEAVGLPEHIGAPRVTSSPTGASAKAVTLELTAKTESSDSDSDSDSGPWSGPFRIIGRVHEDPDRSHPARTSLGGLHASTDLLWLTLLPPPPASKDAPDSPKDTKKKDGRD